MVQQLRRGEREPIKRLAADVYAELHRIAKQQMRRAHARSSLQPTALVHEAYLKLIDQTRVDWRGRTHFCAVAAIAMRRLVQNDARDLLALKRGGNRARITLHEGLSTSGSEHVDVLALHEALERLRSLDARQAEIVELRFFGGLTIAEVAYYLGVSTRTVDDDWAMARAWLRCELAGEGM
jgi:RNA polymerase sigma-70 factor (ECF subfamily)